MSISVGGCCWVGVGCWGVYSWGLVLLGCFGVCLVIFGRCGGVWFLIDVW